MCVCVCACVRACVRVCAITREGGAKQSHTFNSLKQRFIILMSVPTDSLASLSLLLTNCSTWSLHLAGPNSPHNWTPGSSRTIQMMEKGILTTLRLLEKEHLFFPSRWLEPVLPSSQGLVVSSGPPSEPKKAGHVSLVCHVQQTMHAHRYICMHVQMCECTHACGCIYSMYLSMYKHMYKCASAHMHVDAFTVCT